MAQPAGEGLFFQVTKRDRITRARIGTLQTRHGPVSTPAFMPVGTAGSVKAMDPRDLSELGFELILANAYHLFLRPGHQVVERLGGLHRFMGWNRAILTDSGGFQVFSLEALRRLDDAGVEFASHIDGARFVLSPERSMEVQRALDSDLVMPLDDCPPFPAERARVEESVRRTSLWAARSREVPLREGQKRFGIVQGGTYADLRERSASEILSVGFDGYAVGGVGVGEPPEQGQEVVATTLPLFPDGAPRYVMGVGTPGQILAMIGQGADLFDCVLPTRNGRNGTLFTSQGRINIKRKEYESDPDPLDPRCGCHTCRTFSRAYLRHLYRSREILSCQLNTLHNLAYFRSVILRAREAISLGTYVELCALREFSQGSHNDGEGGREGCLSSHLRK